MSARLGIPLTFASIVAAAALGVVACGGDETQEGPIEHPKIIVDIKLVLPPAPPQTSLVEVTRLEINFRSPANKPIATENVTVDANRKFSVETTQIAPGTAVTLQVLAYSASGKLKGRGNSGTVTVPTTAGTPVTAEVLFYPSGQLMSLNGQNPPVRYTPVWGHTATALGADGRLLVVGGATGGEFSASDPANGLKNKLAPAQAFDPQTRQWCSFSTSDCFTGNAAELTTRVFHSATAIDNGRVLIFGGLDNQGDVIGDKALVIYDARARTFQPIDLSKPGLGRIGHAAVQVDSGSVLIAGGMVEEAGAWHALDDAFIVSADGDVNMIKGKLPVAAAFPAAAQGPGQGSAVIAGGYDVAGEGKLAVYKSLAFVDKGEFLNLEINGAPAELASGRYFGRAARLDTGEVIVVGGSEEAPEVVDWAGKAVKVRELELKGGGAKAALARRFHTLTWLDETNGFMVAAGASADDSGDSRADAVLLHATASDGGASEAFELGLVEGSIGNRKLHTTTALTSGLVLIVGGVSANGSVAGTVFGFLPLK